MYIYKNCIFPDPSWDPHSYTLFTEISYLETAYNDTGIQWNSSIATTIGGKKFWALEGGLISGFLPIIIIILLRQIIINAVGDQNEWLS